MNTEQQYQEVVAECRALFAKKLHDYGASWRILRPSSLTDQIMIKALRIRSLETKAEQRVDEDVDNEYIGIVNYGIIGLIQLERIPSDKPDLSSEEALELYDQLIEETYQLMVDKNHDYDEAWRKMRISSITDIILTKIFRTKEIEDLAGKTLVSEGIVANYQDMINYAIFALIKLRFDKV
ncbi:DUF1599 domain-containing protein [Porphyromonas sp.]|mgnify:FL=1|uniref:DUF1599 domain-containing protein n=1 Tax=Porphyromonas sp. TaxID=1924944 RepID=UPI0025F703B8|nr:DUF1599 domain-containing protein [Porphyromonas sp.]